MVSYASGEIQSAVARLGRGESAQNRDNARRETAITRNGTRATQSSRSDAVNAYNARGSRSLGLQPVSACLPARLLIANRVVHKTWKDEALRSIGSRSHSRPKRAKALDYTGPGPTWKTAGENVQPRRAKGPAYAWEACRRLSTGGPPA